MFSSAHLTHKLLIRSKFAKVPLLLILNAASSVSVAGDSISLDTLLLVTSHEDVSRVTRGDETCAPLHGVTATEVQSSGWSVWRRAGRGGAAHTGGGGGGCWHSWRDTVSRCHARPRDGASHLRVIPGRGSRLQGWCRWPGGLSVASPRRSLWLLASCSHPTSSHNYSFFCLVSPPVPRETLGGHQKPSEIFSKSGFENFSLSLFSLSRI